jgi:dihydrofolate reductase
MKSIVVAYDSHRGIGAANDLLWQRDLPADLAHFKMLTMGGSLIMGRNTFESIGRALPGRENIVVTHRPLDVVDIVAVDSLDAAYNVAHGNQFIIGGGQIYEQSLKDADVVYATEVHASFPQAEIFFPELGNEWRETARESNSADERNKYAYDFVTYVRR